MSAKRLEILVYELETNACLGRGWVNLLPNGQLSSPTVCDLHGVHLPQGNYRFEFTGQETLIVLPQRVQ